MKIDTCKLVISMAWRNIWRQKRRSAMVMSTAAIGMFSVVFVMGYANGIFNGMLNDTIHSGLGHIQIRPNGYEDDRKIGSFFENESIPEAVRSLNIPDDISITARLEREGMLRASRFTEGIMLMGIEPDSEINVSNYYKWIRDGEYLTDRNNGLTKVLIGATNSERMDIIPGDYVVIGTGAMDGTTTSIRAEVSGIFQSSTPSIDRHIVLINRADLSQLFSGHENIIGNFTIVSDNIENSVEISESIRKMYLETGADPVDILTYKDLQPELHQLMEMSGTIQRVMYTFLLLGFSLTLLNSILMSVFERIREFGIQRAIGTRPSLLVAGVLTESVIISMIGCTAGGAIGSAIALILGQTGISFAMFAQGLELGGIPVIIYPELDLANMIYAFTIAFFMSIVAGLYPAIKAVRMQPIEAIYTN